MILGDTCTRTCRFCAVRHGLPLPPDQTEPQRLADAVADLRLDYVVITSVTRDDLPDEGAEQFVRCIEAVRRRVPGIRVEVLPPDLHARADLIERICAAGIVVYNHNVETVRRLTPLVRSAANYDRSLGVFEIVGRAAPRVLRKSGIIIGLGETHDEIVETMRDLLKAGCQILTIGQYLQPGPENLPVAKYWTPQEFDEIGRQARQMGFAAVASGPLVRSSYRAGELYAEANGRVSGIGHRASSIEYRGSGSKDRVAGQGLRGPGSNDKHGSNDNGRSDREHALGRR